jgi:hypothetical protein
LRHLVPRGRFLRQWCVLRSANFLLLAGISPPVVFPKIKTFIT